MTGKIKLVECPRDALQGWKTIISSEIKIAYLQTLLEVGFDTIDCGSFVSARAIPQMADTAFVLEEIDTSNSRSKLLCIVANERGALEAAKFSQVNCLGFPFSISPTFQQRNTNSTIHQGWERMLIIRDACVKYDKELVVYLSMGFGNPYGDAYSEEILFEWADKLIDSGVRFISVADTVGLATPEQVSDVMNILIPRYPAIEIGVHLHSSNTNWKEKLNAALNAGCIRFDGALKGIGGCPMADDELVGNMDTELMIPFFQSLDLLPPINTKALSKALMIASEIFS